MKNRTKKSINKNNVVSNELIDKKLQEFYPDFHDIYIEFNKAKNKIAIFNKYKSTLQNNILCLKRLCEKGYDWCAPLVNSYPKFLKNPQSLSCEIFTNNYIEYGLALLFLDDRKILVEKINEKTKSSFARAVEDEDQDTSSEEDDSDEALLAILDGAIDHLLEQCITKNHRIARFKMAQRLDSRLSLIHEKLKDCKSNIQCFERDHHFEETHDTPICQSLRAGIEIPQTESIAFIKESIMDYQETSETKISDDVILKIVRRVSEIEYINGITQGITQDDDSENDDIEYRHNDEILELDTYQEYLNDLVDRGIYESQQAILSDKKIELLEASAKANWYEAHITLGEHFTGIANQKAVMHYEMAIKSFETYLRNSGEASIEEKQKIKDLSVKINNCNTDSKADTFLLVFYI